MLVIGLTGGIATGKSTVAGIFQELGARVIDLDELSRRVVQPGKPAWREIKERFGPGVLKEDNTLDREALARIVFSDPGARRDLEGIVHPRVLDEEKRLLEEIKSSDPKAIVVVEVPLLMELGLEELFDLVVLVYAPRHVQKERLMGEKGYTDEQAEARLGSQMDIEEKRWKSTYTIDNGASLRKTRKQVRELMHRLMNREGGGL